MGQGVLMLVLIAMALLSVAALSAAVAFSQLWHAADVVEKYHAE